MNVGAVYGVSGGGARSEGGKGGFVSVDRGVNGKSLEDMCRI